MSDEGGGFSVGSMASRFGGWELGLVVRGEGEAAFGEGAGVASGPGAGTEVSAEVHDRLGVGGDAVGRRAGVGEGPEASQGVGLADVAFDAEVASDDAPGVAIEDGMSLGAREGEDGAGGRATDAGEGLQGLDVLGDDAGMALDDELGGSMEVAGSGVIAEAGPEVEYLIEVGGGEGVDGRETRHKTFVVRHDGGDLGLLEHDFGDPDSVRGGVLLPGQLFAAVGIEPGEESRGERFGGRRGLLALVLSRGGARELRSRWFWAGQTLEPLSLTLSPEGRGDIEGRGDNEATVRDGIPFSKEAQRHEGRRHHQTGIVRFVI